ncbi:MAG: peptidyl-prolyl cis-trans isomerase [Bacteroidota bacterium]
MQKYSQILLFILSFNTLLNAQKGNDEIIAEVGPIKVTAEEFKKRYEFVPHVGRHIQGREERLKAETIYSIISEKLWALEAEELGFDTTAVMNYSFQAVEEMYLRDALYQKEIKSKLVKDPEKYTEARRRALVYLNTKFLLADDEEEINRIYNELQNGASFDSLLSIRGEAVLQKDGPFQIHFGQIEETVEDSVYSLEVGKFSTPIKSSDGWYIFKLISVTPETIKDDKDIQNIDKNVRQIVEAREENKVYQNYYKSFFPGRKVQTNGEIFWSFSGKVISALENRKKLSDVEDGKTVHLEAEDFNKIKDQFGQDSLELVFIDLEDDPVILEKFLYTFAFEGFYTASSDHDVIRGQLNARVRRFIEQELLAREANTKNVKNDPEVNSDINMWRDYYLASLYKQTLFDSSNVSDEALLNYYNEKRTSENLATQVNIIEIFTDSLEVVEKIFNEVEKEIDFKKIAQKYSNKRVQNAVIESGYFPVTSRGEIGRIAGSLNIGEVYGPIEKENQFVVFKVIDKKESKDTIPDSFDDIKAELKKQLKGENISKKMIENTVKLANKFGVKVNEKLLYNMNIKNYNMLVYRYMGFGGRLLAVPLTPTFIEWVEPWQRSQNDLP